MRWGTALIVGMGAFVSLPAVATDRGSFNERFSIHLGTYWMNSDTTIRADSIDGLALGTSLNLEDTFGFDEQIVFRLEGTWRFNRRHKLLLMYFESKRSAQDVTREHILFDGQDFPLGLDVRANFDFEIFELAYEYDFLHRETYEMGVSLGVHHVDFATGLSTTVSIPGTSLTEELRGAVETKAPLPVLGLRGNWNFAGDFHLQAHAQYFQLKYEGYDGSLLDYQAGLLWQFSRHVGVGIAYNLFKADVGIDDGSSFQGKLNWQYYGTQAYLRATF